MRIEVQPLSRMTPEEFKELVRGKGWTYRALAVRWAMSETRVSQIARDAERPLYYDDAIRALPALPSGKNKKG